MKIQIFKDWTFTWWQMGIFKTTLLAFGIAVGAYWPEFFAGWIKVLLTIFILGWLYLAYFWLKSCKDPESTGEINSY